MSDQALFIRLTNESDKASALEAALSNPDHSLRFNVEVESFELVPGAPFSYWVTDAVRECFRKFPAFEHADRKARQGTATADDARFVRCWWEPNPIDVNRVWFPFAKGGNYSPHYADVHLLFRWEDQGTQILAWGRGRPQNTGFFFRPGLTWPLRTQKGFSLRALPAGCAFGHKGPSAFVEGDDPEYLSALLALGNSAAFFGLVGLHMAFGSYEVGVIQRTPVPPLTGATQAFLAQRANEIWARKHRCDQAEEVSHAFILPALLLGEGESLSDRAAAWVAARQVDDVDIQRLQEEINDRCWDLYGISDEDRLALQEPGSSLIQPEESEIESGSADADEEGDPEVVVNSEQLGKDLASWFFGAAIGRWDRRLASGEATSSISPAPFDMLPSSSRGMLLGSDGLHPAKTPEGQFLCEHDFLVDDEGESLDVIRKITEVLEDVAGSRSDSWLLELERLLGCDLRTWYRRSFFEEHLRRYSRSKRKAPVYWQLGTISGSYSVWLYYPRLSRDSLYRLLNDVVKPKVTFEEQRLAGLREQNARRSELETQEAFVEELQAFRDEVLRVAPLFDPNLDDGVLINAAPLHRLFVNAGWRRDALATWNTLAQGGTDWAHLALNLWPDRVIQKCASEGHLALAHGLVVPLATQTVEHLIEEHRRSAVIAALQNLLNAPLQTGGRTAGRSGQGTRSPRQRGESIARTTRRGA